MGLREYKFSPMHGVLWCNIVLNVCTEIRVVNVCVVLCNSKNKTRVVRKNVTQMRA
jgi:hypothetical protein